jgi:hypothetical protein
MMLDAHPDLAIPPETRFVPRLIRESRGSRTTPERVMSLLEQERNWADFGLDRADLLERLRAHEPLAPAAAVRSFFSAYAARFGKRRWGDKTPTYGRRMPMIAAAVPEACFVHVIRDPRAVADSWRRFRADRGDDPLTAAHWAAVWAATVVGTRVRATRVGRYMEVRFEDLVEAPDATLRRVADFASLPFAAEMLDYHLRAEVRLSELAAGLPLARAQPARTAQDRIGPHWLLVEPPRADRIDSWRETLGEPEQREVAAVAGDLLAELGYSA